MEIKSKIEARQEALSLAIQYSQQNSDNQTNLFNVVCVAKTFEEYIVGTANLPEKTKSIEEMTNECLAAIVPASLGVASMKQDETKQNETAN